MTQGDDSPSPPAARHVPVLPAEVLHYLAPRAGQVVLDCTLGRAGHAALIVPHLAPPPDGGGYIGLDVDPANVEHARAVLAGAAVPVHLIHANFAQARQTLDQLGVTRVHGLLADLGFASTQMDDPARGFSFQAEGPLDMRLDPTLTQTAADLVNNLPQPELADLIYHFGEERLSRKIARKIAEARQASPIHTTTELAELVRRAYGPAGAPHRSRIHPATRTFMALRIAVNQELAALERLLAALPQLLAPQGRAVVISFHSLEDRLVKHAFAELHRAGAARRLTPRPVTTGEEEQRANPRSRSAKLRAMEWRG